MCGAMCLVYSSCEPWPCEEATTIKSRSKRKKKIEGILLTSARGASLFDKETHSFFFHGHFFVCVCVCVNVIVTFIP